MLRSTIPTISWCIKLEKSCHSCLKVIENSCIFLLRKCKNPASSFVGLLLRVIACNSGTQMRVRDSSATRIFF